MYIRLRVYNSGSQLKKKWNFQGYSRKTHVGFPLVLVFDLMEFPQGVRSFQNFQG